MCRKSIQIMWLVITYNKIASFGQEEDEAKFQFFLSHHKFYSWKFIFHLLKLFCCRKPCRTFGSFKEESKYKSYSFLQTFILTHIITVWRFYFLSFYIPHPQLSKLTMWPKLTLSLYSTILPALVYFVHGLLKANTNNFHNNGSGSTTCNFSL